MLECENVAFDTVVRCTIRLRDLASRREICSFFLFVELGFHLAINPFRRKLVECLCRRVENREVVIALAEDLCDFRGELQPL
jgi:hypothetical protein